MLTKDGNTILTVTGAVRIVTDEDLNILGVHGMEPTAQDITLTVGDKTYTATVLPNEIYTIKNGSLTLSERVAFAL